MTRFDFISAAKPAVRVLSEGVFREFPDSHDELCADLCEKHSSRHDPGRHCAEACRDYYDKCLRLLDEISERTELCLYHFISDQKKRDRVRDVLSQVT